MKFCYTLLLILLNISGVILAQTGAIRGFVYEEESEAPITFANVVVKNADDKVVAGVAANDQGYFVVDDLKPGNYSVEVSFIGFNPYIEQVEVKAGKIVSLKVYLAEKTEVLKSVDVSAERQERKTKVNTSVVKLSPKRIQQFSVGGDADIVKAIQVLPGVVSTGDQGGQLYIRGGAPIQNLILMDGMVIYNPFHSIGFFSVFDSDIIESADVYSGGFSAEYGSRSSAVVDIKTRDGNRERFAGKFTASTYTAKGLIETPLTQPKEDGKANTSLLISAKTSYLDETSQIFYDYVDTEFDGLPFSFTDVYAKANAQSDNGSEVNVFGFSFEDAVRFGSGNDINWNANGAGLDFLAIPPANPVLISGDFSISSYNISALQSGNLSESSISGSNFGLDFTYFINESDELKYGVEFFTYKTETTIANLAGTSNTLAENTTETGGYFRYKYGGDRLILEPSFRAHYYSSQNELRLEPRLGAKYNVNEWFRLKGSGGFYSQNLLSSYSDRDVVNLFYGFLSGLSPNELPSTFRGEEVTSTLQLAQHLVLGMEFEVTRNLTVNLEGYIKDFKQITNVNRNKIYEDNAANADQPDVFKTDFILERGLAKGIDLLAKYQTRDIYLWMAYSISEVTRDDGVRTYNPNFDRRHNLNFVGNYQFGRDRQWTASLRYNFGTGFPFTPTQGFYQQQPFTASNGQPSISYPYTNSNGESDVLFGELNSNRLPNYHRLDASIKRVFEMKKTRQLEITGGATNLLNYDNIFFYDRAENQRVNQLPIMPTLSVAYSF